MDFDLLGYGKWNTRADGTVNDESSVAYYLLVAGNNNISNIPQENSQ